MTITASQAAVSTWAGRLLSALVALALLADAVSVLFLPSMTHAEFAAAGFADSAAPPLGIIMLVCAILYAIPRTAVLGAILVTGFLGGGPRAAFTSGTLLCAASCRSFRPDAAARA